MLLTITDRKEIAEHTMAFWFKAEKPVRFIPGQFGSFTLKDPPKTDSKGNTRTFSIASSPEDGQLMNATRMRDSAFKQNLSTLPLGTAVQFMGPMGRFILQQDIPRPAVFLTGGIGITPVRSIVKHATETESAHKLYVFYSNRSPAASAFLKDFQAWDRQNPNLHFIPTISDESPADWNGERGAAVARYFFLPIVKLVAFDPQLPRELGSGFVTLLQQTGPFELELLCEGLTFLHRTPPRGINPLSRCLENQGWLRARIWLISGRIVLWPQLLSAI